MQNLLYIDCENIVNIVQTTVLSKPVEGEAKAFFAKMVGDYWRYIAESAQGEKLEQAKAAASQGYADALADGSLAPCNPTKLGLALNYSVFQYEVLQTPKDAIETADNALQAALEKIDELEEEQFRDAKSIIELLKENMTLWKEEFEQPGDGNDIDDL